MTADGLKTDPGGRFPSWTPGNRPPGSVFAAWIGFTAFILYGALVPFDWVADTGQVLGNLRHVPLNPFLSPETGRHLSIPDVIQNILLFIPFGALGVLAGDPLRPARSRLVFVTALGVVLSAGVESLQLLTADRVASTGDVMVDTAGSLLGAMLVVRFRGPVDEGLRRLRAAALAHARELRSLAIAVGILIITSWQPFDVTLEVGSFVGKLRLLKGDLWQFAGWQHAGTLFMLAAFLAMTLASYLSVRGARRAGLKAMALGSGLVFLLEAGQVFIDSRMPGLADGLLASGGVGVGTAIWTMAGRIAWPGLWLGTLGTLTLAAATLQVFAETGPATRFESLRRTMEFALLYFPLGFWIGQGESTPRRAYTRGFALSVALAASTWALQFWIQGRHPDVALAGVSLTGIALGIRSGTSQA